jgi:hypothetical protein
MIVLLFVLPGMDMVVAANNGAPNTWGASDNGLRTGDDEISSGSREQMQFTFSKPVFLSSYYVVDVFRRKTAGPEQWALP